MRGRRARKGDDATRDALAGAVPMGVGPAAVLGKRRKAGSTPCSADGGTGAKEDMGRRCAAKPSDEPTAHRRPQDMQTPLTAVQAVSCRRSKAIDLFCYEEMDDRFVGFKSSARAHDVDAMHDPNSLEHGAQCANSVFSAGATVPKDKKASLSSYGDLSEVGARCAQSGRHSTPGDELNAVASKLSFSGTDTSRKVGQSMPKMAWSGPKALAKYPMDWSLKRVANITSSTPLDWVVDYRNRRTLPGLLSHMPLSHAACCLNSADQAIQAATHAPSDEAQAIDAPSHSELCCKALLQVCVPHAPAHTGI